MRAPIKEGFILWLTIFFCTSSSAQSLNIVDKRLRSLSGHLKASIKKYEGTVLTEEYISSAEHPQLPDGWELKWNVTPVPDVPDAVDIKATFTVVKGESNATAVSVSFDFATWSRNNYVLVPASVYNGNRYRSIGNAYNPPYPKEMYYNPNVPLTISNNPRLSFEKGKASLVELQTTNTATPSMCFYAPGAKKAFMVFTDQQSKLGNHGLTIAENVAQDSCSFSITAPSMRKLAPGFGDFHASGDKAPDWKTGDELVLHMRVYVVNVQSIPQLLSSFLKVRKDFIGPNQPRNQLPMSSYRNLANTICSNNFREFPIGSYYLPENSSDFQLGWVSGMINTYPMLSLNDGKERKRVGAELDFIVGKMQGASGYFYGGITSTGTLRPEEMHPDYPEIQAMVRKNGDVLFWLIKHLMLLKAQGYASNIKPEWEKAAQKLAAAFVKTWKTHGEFGQFIAPATGEIAVYNSTAGAIVPAGLALAADYLKHPEWLQVAKDAANYYYNKFVVKQGLTGGYCGDISMDADSESSFGFLESLMTLYKYTGDKSWLQKSEVQAALCATWVLSYDPVFPANSQIAKLDGHMAGAVWASIQNKHAAPGACTTSGDCLFKLFRAIGNPLYAELITDIQHAHAEAVNIPPHHITTNNLPGSSMERIQPSDAEGKGAIGNFINTRNSWTETDGVLMALELPGIYLQTDKKLLRVFDHVEAEIASSNTDGTTLRISNKTLYDASVALFAETSEQAAKPLGAVNFLTWPKVDVKAGETIKVLVQKNGKIKLL